MDNNNRFVTGLDVGTENVRAVIASIDNDGKVAIVGYNEGKSAGMRKGIPANLAGPASSIDKMLGDCDIKCWLLTATRARINAGKGAGCRCIDLFSPPSVCSLMSLCPYALMPLCLMPLCRDGTQQVGANSVAGPCFCGEPATENGYTTHIVSQVRQCFADLRRRLDDLRRGGHASNTKHTFLCYQRDYSHWRNTNTRNSALPA